jgi:hypothetical protein
MKDEIPVLFTAILMVYILEASVLLLEVLDGVLEVGDRARLIRVCILSTGLTCKWASRTVGSSSCGPNLCLLNVKVTFLVGNASL